MLDTFINEISQVLAQIQRLTATLKKYLLSKGEYIDSVDLAHVKVEILRIRQLKKYALKKAGLFEEELINSGFSKIMVTLERPTKDLGVGKIALRGEVLTMYLPTQDRESILAFLEIYYPEYKLLDLELNSFGIFINES